MQFTTAGKALVLINVVLSVVLAGLAFGIYSNHVDWPGVNMPANRRASAEYPSKKAAVDDLQKAAPIGVARWNEALTELMTLEKTRPADQATYEQNLRALDKGPSPVRLLVRQAKGGIILGANGLPALKVANPPLLARDDAMAAIERTEKEIADTIEATQKVIQEEQKLTEEINGVGGGQKGLRDLVNEEMVAKENAVKELEYLRPLRYNFQVESMLLDKRGRSLQGRLDELRSAGMALQRR
jgi:hypothetical protein